MEELEQETNFIIEYDLRQKGLWKRSCPPVGFSDCNQNLSTPWISQSKNGLASKDPLSQYTVWDGIHGYHHYGVTLDNLTEHVTLYYPLYSGWDFIVYPSLFKEPSKAACWAISRFKRDGLRNVWGHGKYPLFLTYLDRVVMMKSDVQGAPKNPTAKSMIEKHFF